MRYVLGLDLGIGSIGWAVVGLDAAGSPERIVRIGTHLFESGTEGDAASGRDQSRAGPRRMARQQRKNFRRRVLRRRRLLKALQAAGLLPPLPDGTAATPEAVDALIKGLDADLRGTWEARGVTDHRERQLLPYRLRAEAINRRLEPYEVGRALYHLNQRRGFLSNRKEAAEQGGEAKKGEDLGAVKAEIVELERMMQAAGCRTVGEYLAGLNPTETGERIRDRWTAREMFLAEFNAIWGEQSRHHPSMTQEARRAAHRAIFFQRKLQSSSHLIGRCELEPGRKRAPMSLRITQRFRMLQRVNDLRVREPGELERPLTREERDAVLAALQNGDQTFAALRKLLGLIRRGTTFNLEEGGEKKLPGNRTEAKLRGIFGPRWDTLPEPEKDAVIEDLLCYEKPEALARRGVKRWGLGRESSKAFGELLLEPGHAAHSSAALKRLVARMEEGTPYATACKEEYTDHAAAAQAWDLLPPVESSMGELRNPAVTRALTELRKVVNAIARRFGKPAAVRVELARDLKKSRKHRERLTRENRGREAERARAVARILAETTVAQPSRDDIERVLLAEECGFTCPYTGRSFGMADIVGRRPQYDVEHIWPLSRTLDNGFANKTLCYHEENRSRKGNRTPHEAYYGTPEWETIVARVRRFTGDAAREKLRRFLAAEPDDGFASRQLTETRYISTKAAEFLGLLYGGANGCDPEGNRRVFAVAGGLTGHLRREWGLNAVLGTKDEKNRADHRHHAIDAIVIALTDPRAVQTLQLAAEEASARGRRLFAPIAEPWPGFGQVVREAAAGIVVSYRQSRRLSGKLHADSLYSKPTGPAGERRVRKPVAALSASEVERIADETVKRVIKVRLAESGKPPTETFKDPADAPVIVDRNGVSHPIRTVRLNIEDRPRTIGQGPRTRYVGATEGSNHHIEIWRVTAESGGKRAAGRAVIVPLLEARGRERRPPAEGAEFVFTLAIGEYVLLPRESAPPVLYRVTATSAQQIVLVEHADGRDRKERVKAKQYVTVSPPTLARAGVRKVSVSHLGEIRSAND